MRHRPIPSDDDFMEGEPHDVGMSRDRVVLLLRAPLRHKKLAVFLVLMLTGLGLTAAWFFKPTFQAEAVIAVQKGVTMPSLGDPNRGQQSADFDPVSGVSELVKGRDNLVALVKEIHLVDKIKYPDSAPMTQDQKLQLAAKILEHRLAVKTDEVTVSFTADWDDPQAAYDIVSGAARGFLESRHAAEVAIISDGIGLLEEHAKVQRDAIDEAMSDFLRMKEGWKTPGATAPPGSGPFRPRPATVVGPDPDLAHRLEDKKQQIRETQAERSRQLMEAKSQMAGLLGTYTPSHPSVVALQRKLDTLAEEPQNLTMLKSEERTLLTQLAEASGVKAGGGGVVRGVGGGTPSASGGGSRLPVSAQDLEVADPTSAMALSKLQARIHKYQGFMDQISAAKLELDLAKNAFKYRYNMFRPPEVPLKPKHATRVLFPALGGIVGVLLAFGMSGLMDWMRGRFVEVWQVKERLALPILGEVSEP